MAFHKNPVSKVELRRLAESRLSHRAKTVIDELDELDLQHLLEELEIHQIELEMQNEHLGTTRAQLETALHESSQLYDFLPVAALLLDPGGTITKLNLAAANLLGGERARLLGTKLQTYLAAQCRAGLKSHLERASAAGEVQSGEIGLKINSLHARHARVKAAPLPQSAGWQVILTDITESKRIEDNLRLAEERWKLALEATGDGVWDWNIQTGELVVSKRFEQLYGFEEHEYGQRLEDWTLRIHPGDKAQVMDLVQAALQGTKQSYSCEYRGKCKDASWKWVLARGAIVSHTEDGKPLRMIGTHVDISDKRQIEEALRVVSQFQQAVFDSLPEQIAVLDRHGTILETNAAWCKYALDHGLSQASDPGGGCVGCIYLDLLHRMSGNDHGTALTISTGLALVMGGAVSTFQLPQPFYAPDGQSWFMVRVTPVHDVRGQIVVSHSDVSTLKAAELVSWTLANIDPLTGALSRRNFLNLAEQELTRSRRYELPLMLLMLDLDHFKRINDQYGHAAGDAVLQNFVKSVSGVLRESDLIGRLGGEEFAVLLPNTAFEGGRSLAQRIVENVRTNPVDVENARISYTVSIGASCLSGETSFTSLLGKADAALYRAKNEGRDRVQAGPPA